MADVIFYRSNEEKNVIGKTLTQNAAFPCKFMETVDIETPVILLSTDYSITNSNYVKIPDLNNRYYFITKIEVLPSNLYKIYLECDVLESFKTQILNNQAIIKKQQFDWNLYLNDNTFRVQQNYDVSTVEFPNGFTPDSGTYVMAILGK